MSQRLDILALGRPPCHQIHRDVLGCSFETIEGIPERFPCPSRQEHLVRPNAALAGELASLIGALAMRPATVPGGSAGTLRGPELSPAPFASFQLTQ